MAKLSFNQRYDFIRSLATGKSFNPRAKADPKGVHLTRNPDAAPTFKIVWKGRKRAKPSPYRHSTFGIALSETERRKQWLGEPDHRESHLRHKRRWRANPYGEIAVKLPTKLPVLSAPDDHAELAKRFLKTCGKLK